MDSRDKKRFAEIICGISEDFGGKLSKEGLGFKFKALIEFHIDDIEKAGVWLLKHREATFPAVPTTKEFIDAITLANGKQPRIMAGIEADKVIQTLSEWGRDAEPFFNDKITVYLMTKRWSFQKLDVLNVKDPGLSWWRKDFVQAYQDLGKNRDAGNDVLCLSDGTSERLESIAAGVVKRIGEAK